MRDLIRNYKIASKNGLESDSDDNNESRPLMSSSSLSASNQSFGTCMFKPDSETDTEPEISAAQKNIEYPPVEPISLQQQLNNSRRLLFPSSYETPELDAFETIYNKYEKINDNSCNIFGDFNHGIETHSSLVTIFAIWNTTVGTSLLSMSWGIQKTGLFPAIIINLLIAAICLYTTYTLLKISEKHGIVGEINEVSDLCKLLLGKWAEVLAKIFSIVVLIGANIVYWILMSNFFYNSVHFLYAFLLIPPEIENDTSSVICPREFALMNDSNVSNQINLINFDRFWNLYSTVPIILAVIMFPMLNWKSATFFTKFNSLGTLSVLYLIVFVAAKAYGWGMHIDDWSAEFFLKPTFCALSGMLSLSYFIHNIIISVMRNNRNPQNNGRDLTIAFALITFTYLFIGVLFYVTFPLAKNCIEDNILNNFDKYDTLTIIARVLLLFQLFTVFPLISYMLRNDIFANLSAIFLNSRNINFNYGQVIALNLIILLICVLFACFLPKIGTLIRYTGAMSGLVYIFMLPNMLKIASLRKEKALSYLKLIFHVSIIIVGGLNLISQFFITDK